MQKFRESEESKEKIIEDKELELNELSLHFNAEELLYLPERMKIQAILSMFDLIYYKCDKALERLFPHLFSIGNRRYNIYLKVLLNYEKIESSNDCLDRMLKWLKPYLRENFIINKKKIEKAIKLLKEGKIEELDSLYSILPRKVFFKLRKFEMLREDLNFNSSQEAWSWFLEKELDMLKLEE